MVFKILSVRLTKDRPRYEVKNCLFLLIVNNMPWCPYLDQIANTVTRGITYDDREFIASLWHIVRLDGSVGWFATWGTLSRYLQSYWLNPSSDAEANRNTDGGHTITLSGNTLISRKAMTLTVSRVEYVRNVGNHLCVFATHWVVWFSCGKPIQSYMCLLVSYLA